jgi:hypothetical protein
MAESAEFTFDLRRGEVLQALKLARPGLVIGATIYCYFAAGFLGAVWSKNIAFILIVTVVLGSAFLALYFIAALQKIVSGMRGTEVLMAFSSEGFVQRTALGEGHFLYENFKGWRETDKVVIITFVLGKRFLYFPKRAVDDTHFDQIKQLFANAGLPRL